jgi:hypothetical protein
MAIQYAPSRINATFAGDTKVLIRDGIETNLLAAGWTTVSGSGTADLLMQSALTPQGRQIRMRFRDIGGNCLVASMQNVSGTFIGTVSATAGCFLLPAAGKVFRVVANPYQFFVFTAAVTQPREFIAGGVPYLPSFLVSLITDIGWLTCNSQGDTDTTIRASFRTHMIVVGYQYTLVNASTYQGNGNEFAQGSVDLQTIASGGSAAWRWHDDSAFVYDALLGYGLINNNEAKVRGQLWDALVSSEIYAGDLTTSYDSHNWIVITNNGVALGNTFKSTLFVCIS